MDVSHSASSAPLTDTTTVLQPGSEPWAQAQEKHRDLYNAAMGVSQEAELRKSWGNGGTRGMLRQSIELGANLEVRQSRVFAPILLLCSTVLKTEHTRTDTVGPLDSLSFSFSLTTFKFFLLTPVQQQATDHDSQMSVLRFPGGTTEACLPDDGEPWPPVPVPHTTTALLLCC